MGKKFNSIFMALVFVALTAFLAAGSAEAFCVYNKTEDSLVIAKQVEGGDFQKDVARGKGNEVCCNWQEKSCNKGGKKDSIVKFTIKRWHQAGSGLFPYPIVCEDFPIKAGGWLTVRGNAKDGYKCEAHSDF